MGHQGKRATNKYSKEALDGHLAVLQEKVFQVSTKWPQYRLLLTDICTLADTLPIGSRVVCLERSLLYGGYSLFAPFFDAQHFEGIDCSPASAEARGAYNAEMVSDLRFLQVPCSRRAAAGATKVETGSVDVILLPNLIHHIEDHGALFAEVDRILKPGGRGYLFEPLLRELHQIPDDYLRYTPWGCQAALRRAGLALERFETTGGPFEAIAYCWSQALEYVPEDDRSAMERWFQEEHLPDLLKWDARFRTNLQRDHTAFPTAFSVHFRKPIAA